MRKFSVSYSKKRFFIDIYDLKEYNAKSIEDMIKQTIGDEAKGLKLKDPKEYSIENRKNPGFKTEVVAVDKDDVEGVDWDKIIKKAEELVKEGKLDEIK